jgi:chaperonin GroEL
MSAKEIQFNNAARQQIASGLDQLANVVKVTLGPRGRSVLLDRSWGSPTVTKDGVTVAKEIEIDNRLANLGAQMVKEVASTTADIAGDGTTTATVLAQAIFKEGLKVVVAGVNPLEMKRGIDAAVAVVTSELHRISKPTKGRDEIAQVGTISANGDETIGNLVADALERVGKEGVVTLEDATSIDTTLEVVEGGQFDRGYLSPYFVTDPERMEAVLADAYVLIYEKQISNLAQLVPVLELVAEAGKPLLIIADVESEALATLVVNKLRGVLQICAVKPPGFGTNRQATLQDIAVLTGGRAITSDIGAKLEKLSLTDLGRAKKVIINKDSTVLIRGAGKKSEIEARARQVRKQIEDAQPGHEKQSLQTRLAKLGSGVAVIHIGAATETELKEKKARVEDALHATRAAIEEGIVPGGGVALLRAIPALSKLDLGGEEQIGVNVVRRAIEQPLRQIARNAGVEGAVVIDTVLRGKGAYGYNAASDQYEDLIAAGIVDPTKVVRVALQNAASIAALMLTTEVLIAEHVARPVGVSRTNLGGAS